MYHHFLMCSVSIELISFVYVNISRFIPNNKVLFICIHRVWLTIPTVELFDNVQTHVQLDNVLVCRSSKSTIIFEKNQSPFVEIFHRFFNNFVLPQRDSSVPWTGYKVWVVSRISLFSLIWSYRRTYIRLADETEVPASSNVVQELVTWTYVIHLKVTRKLVTKFGSSHSTVTYGIYNDWIFVLIRAHPWIAPDGNYLIFAQWFERSVRNRRYSIRQSVQSFRSKTVSWWRII